MSGDQSNIPVDGGRPSGGRTYEESPLVEAYLMGDFSVPKSVGV